MKRYQVRLTAEAEGHLDEIERWWSASRPEHPSLPREELAEAGQLLCGNPEVGEKHRRRRGVRVLMLPRSRYFLYSSPRPCAPRLHP